MVERRERDNWIIHTYSAEQAVADGVLVDVERELREEMGFRWPVRLSQNVAGMVDPSKEDRLMGQSKEGRLWDLLFVSQLAIKGADPDERIVGFDVILGQRTSRLWACLDTTSGPAIHIITPEEY
jgi:hypothetical protein